MEEDHTTYTVRHCNFGFWIDGVAIPLDESSALSRVWDYKGFRLQSLAVAKALGAIVAVCRNLADEALWLEAISEKMETQI